MTNGGEPGWPKTFSPEGGGAGMCSISDLAAIGALPTEAGDGLEDLDTYSP